MTKIENPAPQTNVEPLFWYRPFGEDGGYEGPLHAFSTEFAAIPPEKRGQWKPLYPLTPPPQQHVRVKSLEWRKFQPRHRVQEETVADTPFGRYSIVFIGEWQLYWNRAKKPTSRHETAVAAMEAAQADHDKRVLALISTRAPTGPTKADSGAAVIDAEGLLFAANVLLNSLWGKIHSGSRTHEENWAEFERQFPGARLLHDAHKAVTAPSPAP